MQRRRRAAELLGVRLKRVIPGAAKQHKLGVVELSGDEIPRNGQRLRRVVRPAILLAAEIDVAGGLVAHLTEEPTLRRVKRHGHAALHALAHERRSRALVGKGHDGGQQVQRDGLLRVVGEMNDDVLAVQREKRVLGRDVQRVEQLFHSPVSAACLRTYSATEAVSPFRSSLGRHTSLSEQLSQALPGFTRGV